MGRISRADLSGSGKMSTGMERTEGEKAKDLTGMSSAKYASSQF